MLKSVIITPDRELSARLQEVIADLEKVFVLLDMARYPSPVELARMLRTQAPQLVFLSLDSVDCATAVAAQIQHVMPGVQVVAVGRECNASSLMTVMEAGIGEFLAYPFELSCVADCLSRCAQTLTSHPVSAPAGGEIYSFLPSKPGVGTTTLALNTAFAAAESGSKTLLADLDLNCGMVRFMLNLKNRYSITDAVEHAPTMNEELWSRLTCRAGKLHVLHAGTMNPGLGIEAREVQSLFEYVRRKYKTVCVDLSGNLENYALEILHESRNIFLVCTPEVSSLHLAHEKIQYLQRLNLCEKTLVLLNRQSPQVSIAVEEVETLIGLPVAGIFSNDYTRVARAISEGKPLDSGSELGRQCATLARNLVNGTPRFGEYLAPAGFNLSTKQPAESLSR